MSYKNLPQKGKPDGVLLLGSDLDRSNVNDFFPRGVGYPLVRERRQAEHNADNSHNHDRLHTVLSLRPILLCGLRS